MSPPDAFGVGKGAPGEVAGDQFADVAWRFSREPDRGLLT